MRDYSIYINTNNNHIALYMKINKSTIQRTIEQGRIKEALKMFLLLVEQRDARLFDMGILLSSRYSSFKTEQSQGVLADAQAKLTLNRIRASLTGVLHDLDASWEVEKDVVAGSEQNVEQEETIDKKVILFLAANPYDTRQLKLSTEVREIEEGLRRSAKRDSIKLVNKGAVRTTDLTRALLDESPTIVHFSGHGSDYGELIFEDDHGNSHPASIDAIGELFELFSESVECVVLNSCYSESQAKAIAEHIPHVIGMNNEVGDKAAIKFSTAFYDAIGNGKPVPFAFKLAKVAIKLAGIPEAHIPVLLP